MAEIDPVVVKLLIDQRSAIESARRSATQLDQSVAQQERAIKRLETQIKTSSSSIATTLQGLAGAFAGAFTVQSVAALADSFTRLQNSLKVAGLEGQALADVQSRLLALSGQNGVSVEGLAGLYGGLARSQRELGASETELLNLTQATAEALRITGTSTAQASGAILGLSQALSAGTVRAEEYNQILEGGLQPLLQAVANTDKYGGSLARLRTAVNDGTVSARELYQGILAGAAGISEQAAKAALTLEGSMIALRSAFVIFIGQADQSLGVTQAVTEGLELLGKNIDVVAGALAVLATVAGGRLVAGLSASAAAMLVSARNAVILSAAAAGASTQLGVLSVAARGAGGALLGAFGGPVGAAILAVGAALAYASSESFKLRGVTEETQRVNRAAAGGAAALESAIGKLATSYGRAREEALSLIRAQRQIAAFNFAQASGRAQDAAATIRRIRSANVGGGRGASARDEALALAEQDFRAASEAQATALRTLNRADAAIANPPRPGGSGGGSSSGSGSSGGTRRSGPSAEDIQQRFADQLYSLAQQTLSARAALATTAEEEADLARRSVELARLQAVNDVRDDELLDKAQKKRLLQQIDALTDAENERINRDEQLRLEREAADLAQVELEGRVQALRAQEALADNSADRQRLALEIFDLEEREKRAALSRLANNEKLDQATRDRAAAELRYLKASEEDRRKSVELGNASPLARYAQRRTSGAIRDRAEELAVDEIENLRNGLSDGIAKQLGTKSRLIRGLLDILLDEVLFKPIAEALSRSGGAGGGGGILGTIGTVIGSIFGGRASGGYVAPGQMVRVNEGASPGRVEGFVGPSTGGKIVPLGRMTAASPGGGGGGTVRIVIEEAEGFAAKVQTISAGVAVEVHRQTRAGIVGEAVNETFRQAGRSRL